MSRLIDADKLRKDIQSVNEGIEEPKMLVRCENCTHKDRVSDYCMCLNREIKPEDFCSLGIQK